MSKDKEYYICSDPHINHKNLIKGCSNWNDKSGCRPFESREVHNSTIINNINKTVGTDDVLWCLGDWSFGGIGSIWWFRKQLNVKDIRYIFGNHDHHLEANKDLIIEYNGEPTTYFERGDYYTIEYNNRYYKGYLDKSGEEIKFIVPAQNLFTSCKYYDEIEVYGQKYVLSHYAMRVWNKRHHGRYHLYGHSHNTLPERGDRSMDVGFESAKELLGEWRPFAFKEIQPRLQSRTNKPIDHHDESTN